MLKAKVFEIRDSMTFIPALAVKIERDRAEGEAEAYLLGRAGHGEAVQLTHLQTGASQLDLYEWGQNPRTMFVAHQYIEQHFDELEHGAVVDVEFILGIRSSPKESERLDLRGV